jgi:hypothetical protein
VQAAAEPGTVVITDAAHRLVSGLFLVEQLSARDHRASSWILRLSDD